jgi:imidazolonepropionase
MKKIITGFSQLLPMRNLPAKGAINDSELEIIQGGAIVIEGGAIVAIGHFSEIHKKYPNYFVEEVTQKSVAIPGFIDCHTHICFAGSRKNDYAMRLSGKTYLEIAASGGGINSSVANTRAASIEELQSLTLARINRHLQDGVTTIEIKSGYGLNVDDELKILRAINLASQQTAANIVPTWLAAHIKPKDFSGTNREYLENILENLLPKVISENLSKRLDIFVEEGAFTVDEAEFYLSSAKKMGFEITIHADQFSRGAAALAARIGTLSADHMEVSGDEEIAAIASDWNPGSAPMGDLLVQAAIFGACQKLSIAETLAALTFRAAAALNLGDVGSLNVGKFCDLQLYPFDDYRDIFYNQGRVKPFAVYKNGQKI